MSLPLKNGGDRIAKELYMFDLTGNKARYRCFSGGIGAEKSRAGLHARGATDGACLHPARKPLRGVEGGNGETRLVAAL